MRGEATPPVLTEGRLPFQVQLRQWPEAVGARASEKGSHTPWWHGVRGVTIVCGVGEMPGLQGKGLD